MASTRVYRRSDFSMGLQNASSWLLRKPNELEDGRNLRFNQYIGSIVRRNGYIRSGNQFTTTNKKPTGFHTAQFSTGSKKLVALNNDGDTQTIVRAQNNDGTWTTIISDLPPNADVYFCDYRDEVFVSGFTTADGVPFQPRNIDKTLDVSLTRNLLNTAYPKYFVVFKGILYAANVKVGSDIYPDRIYKGSAPTGPVTFVRGAQTDVQIPLTFVNQVPIMTSATAPAGVVAHSQAQATWEGYKIFKQATDRDGGSWFTNDGTATGWVSYDFGAGNDKVITHYMMRPLATSATMGSSDPSGAPRDWQLQGSSNGTTWVDIDARSAQSPFVAGEERTYQTTNTTAYRYYRLNITTTQHTNAPGTDSNWVTMNGLKLYTTLESVRPLQLKVDSVRYLKPGMTFDIYKAGKPTKLYTVTAYDVDKPNNIMQFLPLTQNITVNTTTDIFTIADTSLMPTGTPLIIRSTSTPPVPLTNGGTYYVINLSATTFKLATTLDNATIGQAIDITSTGTAGATHVAVLSYTLSNNDEIYLTGRYGKLTTFWNTDYPTADKADWTAVQPGSDSSNAITGVKESASRLFVYTLNTTNRFDGNAMQNVSKVIGCVSHRTIQNIDDDWLVWLTARGRVYARNEASSQQEYISRGISNKFFDKVPLSQLLTAAAGITDGQYSVFIGAFNGEPTRAVYDFGSNTWDIDALNHNSYMYANDSSSTTIKPFFVSDDGRLFQDDTGDLDDDKAIRFEAVLGKTNYGIENDKRYLGAYIYSRNAIGLKISLAVDNEDAVLVGEIARNYGQLDYPVNDNIRALQGSTATIKILGALKGPAPHIEAFNDIYTMVQEINGHGQKQ